VPARPAGSVVSDVVGALDGRGRVGPWCRAGRYTARSRDGAERGERARLLAGIAELVPWLLQWHDELDPVYGERMGQTFDGFVTAECAALGLTRDELTSDTPFGKSA
jgi:hypothetical protein